MTVESGEMSALPYVLVVEDSGSTRVFVRIALEASQDGWGGAHVVEAGHGFDALRLLPRHPYELVVADVNMPDINGLELVRFIRASEHYVNLPIILISTQAGTRDEERGLALGANVYLAKPFTAVNLRREALRQIARARSTQ